MRVVNVDVVILRVGGFFNKRFLDAAAVQFDVVFRFDEPRRIRARGQAVPVDDDVSRDTDAGRGKCTVHSAPVQQPGLGVHVVDEVGAAQGRVGAGFGEGEAV